MSAVAAVPAIEPAHLADDPALLRAMLAKLLAALRGEPACGLAAPPAGRPAVRVAQSRPTPRGAAAAPPKPPMGQIPFQFLEKVVTPCQAPMYTHGSPPLACHRDLALRVLVLGTCPGVPLARYDHPGLLNTRPGKPLRRILISCTLIRPVQFL